MIHGFRTYELAVAFYRAAQTLTLPPHLRDQMLRASSSIVLNLAEGSAKPTERDRRRFYAIALGSLRKCQAALDLASVAPRALVEQADCLGAHLYRLARPRPS